MELYVVAPGWIRYIALCEDNRCQKKSDAAAFIIWYTRCEEHIEYIDILKCLY